VLDFIKKKKYMLIMPVYMVIYLTAFSWIEKNITSYDIIHVPLDDIIPFCEYFIVPYVAWYFFVAGTVMWFGLNASKEEHNRLAAVLCIGMTAFIVISATFPNGHDLRPQIEGGNIFLEAVQLLYSVDTSTNILPSIHVFNSLACCVALMKNEKFRMNKTCTYGVVILTVLIVLSTVFLKQHSIVDVVIAFMMYDICYVLLYTDCIQLLTRKSLMIK